VTVRVAARIVRRATRVGLRPPAPLTSALTAYLELLARWNRKINLTALPVEPLSDEAIDRLVVEPLVAAGHILANDRLVIDVGSGGGSPAIPLKLAVPRLRFVLIEAKARKSAFLREAVRQLGLDGVTVENRRIEELLTRTELHEEADVITVRAVRMDGRFLNALQAFLRPGGRVFWFGHGTAAVLTVLPPLEDAGTCALVPSQGSALRILRKAQ
jgi:16S rRNA (guanine527-N7)-methyltransferase